MLPWWSWLLIAGGSAVVGWTASAVLERSTTTSSRTWTTSFVNGITVMRPERVGDFLLRGDDLWIAPPRSLLPNLGEQPGDPWFYVGKIPAGYAPEVERRHRGGCPCGCNTNPDDEP